MICNSQIWNGLTSRLLPPKKRCSRSSKFHLPQGSCHARAVPELGLGVPPGNRASPSGGGAGARGMFASQSVNTYRIVEATRSYSSRNNVPFLARNFGNFRLLISTVDIFEESRWGGRGDAKRERATARPRDLWRASATRSNADGQPTTSWRYSADGLQFQRIGGRANGEQPDRNALNSHGARGGPSPSNPGPGGRGQEHEAQTTLPAVQLDYAQAHDELTEATGQFPNDHTLDPFRTRGRKEIV